MNKEETLAEIKNRGYWRINIRPLNLEDKMENIEGCLEHVSQSKVSLRGWSYPHVPAFEADHKGLAPGNDYYEGWINSGIHKEVWRMYMSSQFIHYLALREDWSKEDKLWGRADSPEPGHVLSVLGAVYQMTEIYEFTSRLIQRGLYSNGAKVHINLCNTAGRKLWISDPMRADFIQDYKTADRELDFEKSYSKNDLTVNAATCSYECIVHFFKRFGWSKPNEEVIKKDQEALLSRRI